jgi:hypothetical protein
MNRYLVIVARHRRDLYGYLAQQFAGDDSIRVLMERRSSERRRRWERQDPERRRRDRRAGPPNEDVLSYHGLLILRTSLPQASEPLAELSQAREDWPPSTDGRPAGNRGAVSTAETARRWISEGRRHLSHLLMLFSEQGDLEGRVDALEEKFVSLDQVIRRLHSIHVHAGGAEPQASPSESQDNVPGRPPQP